MAAIWGDDVIVEGEALDLDALEQVLIDNVDLRLGRVGPGQQLTEVTFLKRRPVYLAGFGYKWWENPKHIRSVVESRSEGSPSRRPV